MAEAALPVTITPNPCPWGFNTANRAPSLLEQTRHMLCQAEHSMIAAGARAGADARAALDWLWRRLQALWGDVVTFAKRTWEAAKVEAVALWHDAAAFLDWLNAWLLKWGLIAAAVFLGLFFLP